MSKTKIQLMLGYILNISLLTWVLLGFLLSYLLFFVYPVFFSDQVMQFFKYVPAFNPIGVDLRQMLSYSASWFVDKQTPYIGRNLYPPLTSVLFTPLLILDFSLVYKIITLVNVLCYVLISLIFPLRIGKERQISSLLILFFITGLFSYGFQYELERGQFNVITVFICFLAIWIYHYHSRYRYLAYFLFTISVQLKVFPFIFIVMLISDWRDWKNNIKRFFALAAVNFALLFVLGINVFVDFIYAIKTQIVNPEIGGRNHSIRSFVTMMSNKASEHGWTWINDYTELAQFTLLAIIAICILIIMLQAYRQKQNGINSHLLLACTIGALLIPSVSHDYKLSILAAPVALLFSCSSIVFSERSYAHRQRIIFIVFILLFSIAYSSTLFSNAYKPSTFENNLPALVVMLLLITFHSLVFKTNLDKKIPKPIETA